MSSSELHILIFAHFAGSPYHGMVYGHYYLAREWVKAGHQVSIVAASFAHTRFRQPLQVKRLSEEIIDGIRYIWLPTPAYDPSKYMGRIRNILSFGFKSRFSKIPLNKADLVICSSHHPFPVYAARYYARKLSAPLVFEVRDLWPLTLIELGGANRRNPFIALMQAAEDYAYRHANKVVSVLSGAKPYMVGRGMDPNKFVYVPNGISVPESDLPAPLPLAHQKALDNFRKDKQLIVGYAGRIGLSNALHVLIEATALACNRSIGVVILGSGSHLPNIKQIIKDKDLSSQVLLLDPVPKDRVPDFLDKIDVAYLGLPNKPLFQLGVSPTKLGDFLIAAKPLIFAANASCKVVVDSKAGMICPGEDPQALGALLNRFCSMSCEDRAAMGLRGREWALRNLDYRLLAKSFLKEVMPDEYQDISHE